MFTYLGYTVIHFLAQIGTPLGCELYIDPDTLLQRGVGSHMAACPLDKHMHEFSFKCLKGERTGFSVKP